MASKSNKLIKKMNPQNSTKLQLYHTLCISLARERSRKELATAETISSHMLASAAVRMCHEST
jgi:hypothetical protein